MNLPIRQDLAFYGKLAQHRAGYVAGQVEVTSKCSQMCAMCESWRDDRSGAFSSAWSFGQLCGLFDQCAAMPTFEHLTLTGGDPQSWPLLNDALDYYSRKLYRRRFELQLNTALVKPLTVMDAAMWPVLRDVRVSLDGVTRETYTKMRGDKVTDPMEVVDRIKGLLKFGIRVATNTCVTTRNVHEVQLIIDTLSRCVPDLRKAMFLAVIGDRDAAKNRDEMEFWRQWDVAAHNALDWAANGRLPSVSFQENPAHVRRFLAENPGATEIGCHTSVLTFHAKCNGDVYPCCLVGGEAIKTHPEMAYGNLWREDLATVHARTSAERHYGDPSKPCSRICQWKQLNLNLAGHAATTTRLSMP